MIQNNNLWYLHYRQIYNEISKSPVSKQCIDHLQNFENMLKLLQLKAKLLQTCHCQLEPDIVNNKSLQSVDYSRIRVQIGLLNRPSHNRQACLKGLRPRQKASLNRVGRVTPIMSSDSLSQTDVYTLQFRPTRAGRPLTLLALPLIVNMLIFFVFVLQVCKSQLYFSCSLAS